MALKKKKKKKAQHRLKLKFGKSQLGTPKLQTAYKSWNTLNPLFI